ncbi:MAG: hypothetical protein WKF37_15075 [Bryobacteraceae bacterium]
MVFRFGQRYPAPLNEARELSPEILAELDSGFEVQTHRRFEIALPLSPAFYLDYMLTETNVACRAPGRGIPADPIVVRGDARPGMAG